MPKVKVNGIEVEVPAGTNMVDAAKVAGVDIPHYCYHPHLPVAGNCRMCVVDVEAGGRGPDIACNMQARDGLEIRTDSPRVKAMRQSVMEFLLQNHPLDCPICDQSGECRLQDYYMEHGQYESRVADAKVHKHKRQDLGEYVMLDAERCIACGRCVRFGDEVTGTGELRLFNRTDHSEIGVFPGTRITHHYQGCLAEICPVGALTNKDFRFKKRVWYLNETASVCDGCATGCNMEVGHQDGEVFRYKARRNDAVNKSWMCDFGRMSYKRVDSNERMLRATQSGTPLPLGDALQAVATLIQDVVSKHGARAIGGVLGTHATNEANWAMLELFERHLAGGRLFACEGNDPDAIDYTDDLLVDADKNPNTHGVRLLAQYHDEVGDKAQLAAASDLKLLIVLEDDLVGRMGSLPAGATVVYLGGWANATTKQARITLPASAHIEQDGSFTNKGGRVQRLRLAVPPAGDSRPAYELLDRVAALLGKPLGCHTGRAAFRSLGKAVPAFTGLSYATLGAMGALVHEPETTAPRPIPTSTPSPA